jgi:pimeloyl-ACP methyl ester carboxylesterase
MVGQPLPDLTHHRVHVRGIGIHVVEAGEGPPLVLQHGFPQDWRSWQAVIPILAEHFRVICPDMRGFGESEAPAWGYDKEGLAQDLLAVCDALEVERFALAGHDWGGVVSFIAAVRAPERVERLILLNTAHGFWNVDPNFVLALRGFWYMPLIGTPVLGSALIRTRSFQRLVLSWADPDLDWDAATTDAFLTPLRNEPARASAARRLYGRFVFGGEFAEILRGRYTRERLTVPTLLLHGTADRAIRPAILRGHEPYAAQLRVEFIPGAGHFLCDAAPERVAARVIKFVAADG